MEKVFVVTGVYMDEDGEMESIKTIYAGANEEEAKDIDITNYSYLELNIWAHGEIIKTYIREDIYRWCLKYDKKKEFETAIKEREKELAELKREYNDFLSLFEGNNE